MDTCILRGTDFFIFYFLIDDMIPFAEYGSGKLFVIVHAGL